MISCKEKMKATDSLKIPQKKCKEVIKPFQKVFGKEGNNLVCLVLEISSVVALKETRAQITLD